MKKKIFTLLTLLVFLGGGKSWGTDYTELFSVTSPTNKSLTQNGVTVSSGNNVADKAFGGADPAIKCYKIDSKQLNVYSTKVNIRKIVFTACSAKDNTQSSLKIQTCATESGTYADATSSDITISGGETGTSTTESTNTIVCPYSTSYTTATIEFASDVQYVHIVRSGETWINSIQVYCEAKTATSEVLKTSYAVKVDDTPLELNAATSGYTVSSTTITLSDDIAVTSAPTNVELVKTISYSNSTTEDEDVAVTFDGTVTAGYFTGTATIGETVYTVKVKKDVTPTIALSSATGTISLKSYEATGTAKVTLTGANLANGTFNAPTASGVTVTPATVDITDGTIDQEFTITPSATTAAETVLAFAYTGATTQNYTLNYSKTAQRTLTKTNVTGSTTWDWSKAGGNTIQLTADTDPAKDTDFLMSNIAEIANDANFNSQALVLACEYADRNGYTQAKSVKFTTTVPGTIDVDFSNTGGSRPYRYLYVNGNATEFKSETANKVSATGIAVPAGEVVLKGYIPNASDPQTREGDNVGDTYLRIYKIVFTPLASGDVVEVTTAAYATHVLADDIDFTATSDVKAYAAKVEGDKITLTEVSAAPKGTPLVIAATKDVYTLTKAATTPAAVTDNDLVAGPVTGDGSSYYVLGKDADGKLGFGLLASGSTLPGTKAYIPASKFTSAPSFAYFDGETTGVSEVRSQKEDVRGEYFNLNGQRVAQPTKGLYIVNGRKVVVK